MAYSFCLSCELFFEFFLQILNVGVGLVCVVAFEIDIFLDFRNGIGWFLLLLIFEGQKFSLFSGCISNYLDFCYGSLSGMRALIGSMSSLTSLFS